MQANKGHNSHINQNPYNKIQAKGAFKPKILYNSNNNNNKKQDFLSKSSNSINPSNFTQAHHSDNRDNQIIKLTHINKLIMITVLTHLFLNNINRQMFFNMDRVI
jgi:hypothetical protein